MAQHITNYLPLSREYFKHDLWQHNREFSPAEAWLWLIYEAKYTPGKTTKYQHGRRISYSRGELTASLRSLQAAWGWGSDCRVRNFLQYLEEENMITVDNSQGQNVITLNNYPKYNPSFSEPNPRQAERSDLQESEGPGRVTKSKPPTKNSTLKTKNSDPSQTTKTLIDLWNQHNGTNLRSARSRIPQIRQRLKTFSIDELKTAIKNRAADPWIKQNNQQSNWDAVFRNDRQVEHWLERTPEQSPSRNGTTGKTLTREEAQQHAKKNNKPFKPPFYQKTKSGDYVPMFN